MTDLEQIADEAKQSNLSTPKQKKHKERKVSRVIKVAKDNMSETKVGKNDQNLVIH
ncbi:hypothetical protein ACT691_00895 [Vibrio metschnikovii]